MKIDGWHTYLFTMATSAIRAFAFTTVACATGRIFCAISVIEARIFCTRRHLGVAVVPGETRLAKALGCSWGLRQANSTVFAQIIVAAWFVEEGPFVVWKIRYLGIIGYYSIIDLTLSITISYRTQGCLNRGPQIFGRSINPIPTKGQLILKANCSAVDSPKKRTNEFVFFALESSCTVGT